MKPFKKGTEINKQDEDIKKRKLFVKGLPSSCSNAQLHAAFACFGAIDKAFILFDHTSGTSRGFGFVEFIDEASVNRALSVNVTIDGKTLKCSPAILKQEVKVAPSEPKKSKNSSEEFEYDPPPSQSRTNREVKIKKNQPQLKSITLKEDFSGEEGTKESSGNSSVDRFSKDTFGSPIVYSGYQTQTCGFLDQGIKSFDSPLSIFHQPFPQQMFFPGPLQANNSYPFQNEELPKGLMSKPWSSGQVKANVGPSQTKSTRSSFYRMF